MPQILFLNRCYWPDSEATGQLLTDLCEHLTDSFDVHVVCGQPNSPTRDDYQREGTEVRGGVTIHRLRHTRFAKRVPAGRLLNIASFSRATAKYLRRSQLSPDIIVCETDPFLLPIVAAKHSRRCGAKLVCYLQDIYPDVAEAIGKVKSGMLTRQIRSRLQSSYQASDRVIVLGDCMRARLESPPWSLSPETTRVIPNWADCESIQPFDIDKNPFREREGLQDKFVVMHSGNMGLTQRLDVLINATHDPAWPSNAVLLLVGDGAAKQQLKAQAATLQPPTTTSPSTTTSPTNPPPETRNPLLSKIRFLPYQPREELAQSLSAADLHVVSMHENISGCLCPSKLYGILAAGRPVLAIASETTDLCQTVMEHKLGWRCDPGDSQAIAQAVAAAAQDKTRHTIGQQARAIACKHYDKAVVTQQFKTMLQELITQTK